MDHRFFLYRKSILLDKILVVYRSYISPLTFFFEVIYICRFYNLRQIIYCKSAVRVFVQELTSTKVISDSERTIASVDRKHSKLSRQQYDQKCRKNMNKRWQNSKFSFFYMKFEIRSPENPWQRVPILCSINLILRKFY